MAKDEHSTLNKSESLESHDFGGCEVSGMVSKFETTRVILCGGADVGVRACMRTPRCVRESVTGLSSSRLLGKWYAILIVVRQRTVYDTIMTFPPLKVWACSAFVFLGVLTIAQMARAADTQPPTVTITQPRNGSTLNGVVTIAASARDNVGVASVSFKLDGAPVGSLILSPPFKLFLNTAGLAKGVHSLLAVATDTAGNIGLSPLVQITVTNPALYTLGPGPFTVTNLGYVISANTIDSTAFFQLSNDTHFVSDYIGNYGSTPLQILDVDLTQGTARLTNGVNGRNNGTWTLYPNGKIYLASSEANGAGYFMEYNPTTGTTRQIAQTTGYWSQTADIGDDGWVYIGEFPCAYVDRYNPNTDTFQSLGNMESETNTDFGSYAYTLGADTRYLYVTIGESPWFLVVYDTQTTSTTRYWATNGDSGAGIEHGTNGFWYYYRGIPTPTYHVVWYQLTNGVPVLLANPPTGLFIQNVQQGNMVHGVANSSLVGISNVNLDYALPNSSSNYAIIRWQTVGATNWQSVSIGGFRLDPLTVFRLYPWDSTHLLSFGFTYGPVFTWDINSHQTTTLGSPQCDVYDIIFGQGSPPVVAYFSAYPTTMLRYDPSRPWTLVASTTNFFNTNINPYQISLTIGKHDFFSAFGADGMVYVAAEHERNSVGGELGWWDPVTGTNSSLRTPFTNAVDTPSDLKPALAGTKLVYVGAVDTNLFIFDVATKTITNIIPISLPGVSNLDKVVEVAPGIMLGDAGNIIFEVNITNGAIVQTNTFHGGGAAFVVNTSQYNNRLVLGPDGYVWLPITATNSYNQFTEYYICRVNPANGSSTNLIDVGYFGFSPPNLMFNGGDMYLYGATNLCRIQGVLTPVGPTQPLGLSVVPPGQ
jgi:hypothetical protein